MRKYKLKSVMIASDIKNISNIKGVIKVGIFKCILQLDGREQQSFSRNPILNYIDNKLNGSGYHYLEYKSSIHSVSISEEYSLTQEYIILTATIWDNDNNQKTYVGGRQA